MAYNMKGFSGFGNSPLKRKDVDWSKAPGLHTHARRRWYKKHNLKQDKTTTTEGWHSKKTGGWVSGIPTDYKDIDLTKVSSTSDQALWHSNLKTQAGLKPGGEKYKGDI
jgi:hypothetical protein